MSRDYTFKDSRDSRGNGYSGYVENGQLVLEYDDPRSGGEYFRGSYDQAWHLGHIERLKRDDPRLYNAIEKYYSKHDPDVSVREKTSSPAGVLWQVKLYMDNGRELNCQVRGLNEACVIKKLFPKIPEVLTLQGWNANVCAVDSKKIMAVEFIDSGYAVYNADKADKVDDLLCRLYKYVGDYAVGKTQNFEEVFKDIDAAADLIKSWRK